MNKFGFAAKLLHSNLTGKQVPLQVNIHLLDRCNLRCNYCYIDFDNPHKEISFENLSRMLSEIADMGGERISLEGGEPLLRKDIGDIVDHIHSIGLETNINTNGYFLPKKIKQLKNVAMFTVSLDGNRESHDKARGEGSFDKAINAIKVAMDHGHKVHVIAVLNKQNMHTFDELLALAKEVGFMIVPTTLFFAPGNEYEEGKDGHYTPSDTEYRALFDRIISLKKQGEPISWSMETLKYVRNWPTTFQQSSIEFLSQFPDFKPVTCKAGVNFCVVQTNGDLYTCDPLLGNENRANAIELGFKEAFRQILAGKECNACNSLVCTELHQLFSLNPKVVTNVVKNYGRVPQGQQAESAL